MRSGRMAYSARARSCGQPYVALNRVRTRPWRIMNSLTISKQTPAFPGLAIGPKRFIGAVADQIAAQRLRLVICHVPLKDLHRHVQTAPPVGEDVTQRWRGFADQVGLPAVIRIGQSLLSPKTAA